MMWYIALIGGLIVGFSFGGIVGMLFAINRHDNFRRTQGMCPAEYMDGQGI
jgi:hypothetical protein